MTRKEAREQAFILIFESGFKSESLDDIIAQAAESRAIEVDKFAYELAQKALDNKEKIDENCFERSRDAAQISRIYLLYVNSSLLKVDRRRRSRPVRRGGKIYQGGQIRGKRSDVGRV